MSTTFIKTWTPSNRGGEQYEIKIEGDRWGIVHLPERTPVPILTEAQYAKWKKKPKKPKRPRPGY